MVNDSKGGVNMKRREFLAGVAAIPMIGFVPAPPPDRLCGREWLVGGFYWGDDLFVSDWLIKCRFVLAGGIAIVDTKTNNLQAVIDINDDGSFTFHQSRHQVAQIVPNSLVTCPETRQCYRLVDLLEPERATEWRMEASKHETSDSGNSAM